MRAGFPKTVYGSGGLAAFAAQTLLAHAIWGVVIVSTNNQTLFKTSYGDRIFDAINFTVLTLIFIVVAYPLYFIIISSFSNPAAVAGGEVIWHPKGISLDGYKAVFEDKNVVYGFANALIYSVVGTAINLFVTLPTAYALSRKDFYGRKPIMIYYIITMFVSGGLIPTYLVVKACGFIDTIWALVIPGALSVYNMIVARTFFQTTIPSELFDAAKLDGCGNTKFFLYIVLPMSHAIITILVLYYGIGHWNSYFSPMIYLITPEKFPLQLVLRNILILNATDAQHLTSSVEILEEVERKRQTAELMKYSLIIISSIPVILIYPFAQKHFVKGVMIGSIKG